MLPFGGTTTGVCEKSFNLTGYMAMQFKNMKPTILSALVLLSTQQLAYAEHGMAATHIVTNEAASFSIQSFSQSTRSQVIFNVSVQNRSGEALHDVTLEATGLGFSFDPEDNTLHVGVIPVGGIITVQWLADTPVDKSYFESGAPIFFRATANKANGDVVSFPVISKMAGGV
jgi:hypothetical protein